MNKIYQKYSPKVTQAFMTRLTEYVETEEFANDLYNDAITLYADNKCTTNMTCLYGKYYNNILQLITISADLGNKSAISWLSEHNPYITGCLAENLETCTYDLFMDRSKLEKNAYSLCMLGVINNVCNNPDVWDTPNRDSRLSIVDEQERLATMYYTQAGEKGNPQGFFNLAYMLCDIDEANESEEMRKETNTRIKALVEQAEKLGGKDNVLSNLAGKL